MNTVKRLILALILIGIIAGVSPTLTHAGSTTVEGLNGGSYPQPEYRLADIYFGPVDFVEDNVEKLDRKVREFYRNKCSDPQTPELRVECFNRGLFDFPAVGKCSEITVADTESGERIVETALTDRGEFFVGTETDTFSGFTQFEGDTLGLYKINIGFNTTSGMPVCQLENRAEIMNESNFGTLVADTEEGVYVGTKDKVRKYNFNLGQEWTADPNGTTEKIAIGPDGRVFAGGRDDLDAINPTNGTVLGPFGSPSWGLCGNKDDFIDNLVYGEKNNVYYLNKRDNMGADTVAEVVSCDADDGTVNWRNPVKVPVGAPTDTFSAMVPGDSTLFVRGEARSAGTREGKLIAYDLNGDSQWDKSYTGRDVDHFEPMLVRENGLLYGRADTDNRKENLLMVVDGTDTGEGEFKSKFTLSDSQIFPGVLGQNAAFTGTFEETEGEIFKLDFNDLTLEPICGDSCSQDFKPRLSKTRPVALNNSNLIVIHDSTKISSFSVTSDKFTESLWPIVNGNNQNNRSVSDF